MTCSHASRRFPWPALVRLRTFRHQRANLFAASFSAYRVAWEC